MARTCRLLLATSRHVRRESCPPQVAGSAPRQSDVVFGDLYRSANAKFLDAHVSEEKDGENTQHYESARPSPNRAPTQGRAERYAGEVPYHERWVAHGKADSVALPRSSEDRCVTNRDFFSHLFASARGGNQQVTRFRVEACTRRCRKPTRRNTGHAAEALKQAAVYVPDSTH